ncbi:MAG: hypothetical protein CMF31_09395 [Kordiimonas sp.]|nr:hypothetical protein [Kordiimonas sp.]|tara:strand:- start:9079 stop:9573 length:495 start_codon:yes stop_codon:yes gene_type:complete
MSERSKTSKIVTPPTNLRDKLRSVSSGISEREAIERANQAIDSLKNDYSKALAKDLSDLFESFQNFETEVARSNGKDTQLFAKSFEIKGLAGTFGYDVVSQVCASLCQVLSEINPQHAQYIAAIESHIGALRALIQEKALDQNSPIAQAIIRELTTLTAKMRTM